MKHLIPILFLVLASCKSELPDIPKDVIPMDRMKLIMTDMHIADAVAATKAQAGENEKLNSQSLNERIFIIHGTNREEFTRSYEFYESHPELLNKMYDDILNTLSKREEAEGARYLD